MTIFSYSDSSLPNHTRLAELSEVFRRSVLAQSIDATDRARILASAVPCVIDARAVLFQQDDIAREVVLLARGRVRLERARSGVPAVTVLLAQAGDMVDCGSAIPRLRHTCTATALCECEVLSWPSDRFRELMTLVPTLAANVTAVLGMQAQHFLDRLLERSSESTEQRLARTLLRIFERLAGANRSQAVALVLTRRQIAELAGTNLYHASRILSRWNRIGLVTAGRRHVAARDLARLHLVARGEPEAGSLQNAIL